MTEVITEQDEDAKLAVFKVVGDATEAWHVARGRPTVHADVFIEPLLNHIHRAIEGCTQCPACRAELRIRAANFLLDDLGIHLTQEAGPEHQPEHLH